MRKQKKNLSIKTDAQLEWDMGNRLRNCCNKGLARGRDIEFGYASRALLLAGLPDRRIRMAAPAMIAKMAQHGFDISEIESMGFMNALRDPLCVMPAWGGLNDDCPGRRIVVTDRVIDDHENGCPGLLCFILPSDAEMDWNMSHGRNWIDVTSFHPRSFNYVLSRMMDLLQGGRHNLERNLDYVSCISENVLRHMALDSNDFIRRKVAGITRDESLLASMCQDSDKDVRDIAFRSMQNKAGMEPKRKVRKSVGMHM